MNYRHLGDTGLKVSELSLGSWVTFGNQVGVGETVETMAAAYDAGINFFDNAEVYAGGESERIMGRALKELGWRRGSYLVSTKLFWGLHDTPNERNTLNRKYLLEGIDGSLERLDLDYVDLLFCHRPDPMAPVEETVRAMHDIVARGKALYWGTSEWEPADIIAAIEIAERHHLHKPVVESMGASLAQFSIVWCLQNEYVSTVMLGASRPEQLEENLGALDFVDRITPEIMDSVDEIFG